MCPVIFRRSRVCVCTCLDRKLSVSKEKRACWSNLTYSGLCGLYTRDQTRRRETQSTVQRVSFMCCGRSFTTTIFISLKIHTTQQSIQKTTEAGCQRGTKTYQCWPPLQLNDTIQALHHDQHDCARRQKANRTLCYCSKAPCIRVRVLV